MNFRKISSDFTLGILLFLLISSCKSDVDKTILQSDNFWIVLDADLACESDNAQIWNFKLDKEGKYDLQIICEGELETIDAEITIESDGMVFNEMPKKVGLVTEDGIKKTVFQFDKNLVYTKAGLKSLKVVSNLAFSKMRITPLYRGKLGFGSGKYDAEWQEMHNSPEKKAALAWLKEAKYGMFIHWGLYSQAGGIWKGQNMEDCENIGPKVSEWLMFKFQIPRSEYAELAKTFNPDKSFAKNIARLAKEAGMKYIVITSKHHDGFALFDSKCSDFDMVDATPYKADAIKELYEACLAEGIGFGVYYSHGNDWYDGTDGNYANVKEANDKVGIRSHALGKNLWDPSPNTHAEYIENKALPQVIELVNNLPDLRIVWFDGDGYITEDQAFQFYKTIYDLNPNVIVSRRVGYDFGDYLDAGDNVIPSANEEMTKQWETCGTTNNSWAYKSYDEDFKSTQEMLYYLVDIATKGGNYLLNIGPDGKGAVPAQSADGLREIGQWLAINGDAIYGTTPWIITREGQDETLLEGTEHRAKKGFSRTFSASDFWFTTKSNKAYAISFTIPESEVIIKSLNTANGKVVNVRLLGNADKISWEQNKEYLQVKVPEQVVSSTAYVWEISLN